MDAAAELERNPASKREIQSEYGDEQADAGRNCRTRLGRPNSQARTRTGKYAGLATLPVDPYSCYTCDYTYIQTYDIDNNQTPGSMLVHKTRNKNRINKNNTDWWGGGTGLY